MRVRCLSILAYAGMLILFNACGFIFTGKTKKVRVITPQPASVVYQSLDQSIDTIPTTRNEAVLFFERSNMPAVFTVITDTARQTIELEPTNSFEYNYRNIPTFGLASIFFRSNPKSYSYPSKVFTSPGDKSNAFKTLPDNNKGSIYGHVSVPLFNLFHSRPTRYEPQHNFGMLGFSAGADFYYHHKRFVTVEGLTAFNIWMHPVHDPQAYESVNTFYIGVLHNHDLKNVSIGYGLTYGFNDWRILESSLYDDPYKQRFNTLGVIGKVYHRFNANWSAGLIYRPTFLRSNGTWAYEHLISVDIALRIRLRRPQ